MPQPLTPLAIEHVEIAPVRRKRESGRIPCGRNQPVPIARRTPRVEYGDGVESGKRNVEPFSVGAERFRARLGPVRRAGIEPQVESSHDARLTRKRDDRDAIDVRKRDVREFVRCGVNHRRTRCGPADDLRAVGCRVHADRRGIAELSRRPKIRRRSAMRTSPDRKPARELRASRRRFDRRVSRETGPGGEDVTIAGGDVKRKIADRQASAAPLREARSIATTALPRLSATYAVRSFGRNRDLGGKGAPACHGRQWRSTGPAASVARCRRDRRLAPSRCAPSEARTIVRDGSFGSRATAMPMKNDADGSRYSLAIRMVFVSTTESDELGGAPSLETIA